MYTLTTGRAQEIYQLATNPPDPKACGPWVDRLDKIMTREERNAVKDYWETLDGNTTFVTAFMHFVKGEVSCS